MRILMLAQFYPPAIGGEERHVRDLAIKLTDRGHDVSLATAWHKGSQQFENDQGVHVYRIRGTTQRLSSLFSYSDRHYSPPFPDPESLLALRRIILEERPEIVHAHNWIVHSFTPLKTWSKAKLVMTLHDYSLVCVQKRLRYHGNHCNGPSLMKCLDCATDFYGGPKGSVTTIANGFWAARETRVVNMFLPVSQAVVDGNQLDKHKVPYRIIPNFIPDHVDTVCDDDVNSFLEQLPKGDFLLFVGDLMPDKGVDVLLQAYTEIDAQIPLVLIGRPSLHLYKNFPPNVLHLGAWPHAAVMEAWRRCTIALIPSVWPDPCPTVTMEAMAMGKPVIAARSGGLIDIVADGKTGFLVPPGKPQELRQAIQCLLDDPIKREQLGLMAMERVVKFQAQSVVPRIEQVYQELLDMNSIDIYQETQDEAGKYCGA